MRLVLLVAIAALGIDAYFYSGAYTQTAVHEVSAQVHKLAANSDTGSERPAPPRPVPDHS